MSPSCRSLLVECDGSEPYAHRLYVGDVAVEGRNYACPTPFMHPCLSTPPDAYAWPGGYTIVYYYFDERGHAGGIFCAKCAGKLRDEKRFEGEHVDITQYHRFHQNLRNVIIAETYDEGPTEECSDCGCSIESSYGDPDAEPNSTNDPT